MAGRQKARKYDIGNTNIAGLGTNLEKAVRQAAAECEGEWKAAGKSEGIQIWRIEAFKVVPWPKDKYGKFFSGDSYIVLNTFKRNGTGALAWNAHFWIGDYSSQDEYGTAAYKTVELDDYLGGAATQYREVQGRESRTFLKLFKNIVVLEGGVDSGFNHVKPLEYRHRLLHIKGRMNVIVREVPISCSSLNSGDSFVYDGGLQVLVWHGKDAAPMEKNKASALGKAMSDERGGRVQLTVFTEGEGDGEWWKALGSKGAVKSAAEGGDDESAVSRARVLLRVSDSSGKLAMTEVARGEKIRRDNLVSSDVFILDDGYEVMVWVGKSASREERRQGLNLAAKYLQQSGLPADTPISSSLEGGENETFEQSFEVGVMSTARPGTGTKFTGNIDAIRGKQTTKGAAASVSPTYAGSGGPGVATDFDQVYSQGSADPAAWKGRGKAESEYSQSLQKDKQGAYAAGSGVVSSLSASQRMDRDTRVRDLEGQHAGAAAAAAAATSSGVPGLALEVSKTGYAGPLVWSGAVVPSLQPGSTFDAKSDAQTLRKAMKGMGTNEGALISILCRRPLRQRMAIREAYKTFVMRDLEKDLAAETSGNFCRVLKALVRQPADRDAKFVSLAVKGAGTDDTTLIELLCTKNAAELRDIKSAYTRMFPGRTVEKDVGDDTSGDYKALLLAILECKRADPSTPLNMAQADQDAASLYKAGEAKLGTDEKVFIEIFTTRSFPQLLATFDKYHKICKYDIRESVARETSFNFRGGLQAIVDYARSPVHYFARRLYRAMKGLGTHNLSLIFILIDRAEIDLASIASIFPGLYGASLVDMVRADTSGDYQKALLAVLGA